MKIGDRVSFAAEVIVGMFVQITGRITAINGNDAVVTSDNGVDFTVELSRLHRVV